MQFLYLIKISYMKKEKNVILGWNRRGKIIIRELDEYVSEGSEIHIISEYEGIKDTVKEIKKTVKNQEIKFHQGNISDRAVLEENDITSYDNIIILSYIMGGI